MMFNSITWWPCIRGHWAWPLFWLMLMENWFLSLALLVSDCCALLQMTAGRTVFDGRSRQQTMWVKVTRFTCTFSYHISQRCFSLFSMIITSTCKLTVIYIHTIQVPLTSAGNEDLYTQTPSKVSVAVVLAVTQSISPDYISPEAVNRIIVFLPETDSTVTMFT